MADFQPKSFREQIPAESLLAQAKTIGNLPPEDRRNSIGWIIANSFIFPELSIADIYEAAYGDRNGREYWRGWFAADWSSMYEFGRMLVAHLSKTASIKERQQHSQLMQNKDMPYYTMLWLSSTDPLQGKLEKRVCKAFSIAINNREGWIRGDIEHLPIDYAHLVNLSRVEVNRAGAARWFFKHPDFHHLLPETAVLTLESDDAPKAVRTTPAESWPDGASPPLRQGSQSEAVRFAFMSLFVQGIPSRGAMTNDHLVGVVQDYLKQHQLPNASPDTILRRAGRKAS
ncbi:hypothetical protein OPKNFCMD_5459 [Methylobacterium crusticola]|uniref:Uncharacterized protein n=1 Tax=Methylobacterium crusticola TaxID=1697972 RepID=A0ABQ4R4W5_9HYPH|nr:hypothetical protein [Methylobacterium crusticola]GJD52693.1 hypothetical protein OPKNFCMD_5459 [Methylobacterium crusticola]